MRAMVRRGGPAVSILLLSALAAVPAAAQQPEEKPRETPKETPLEALADPARIAPAAVAYVHPLFRPLDQPPRIVERPAPVDIEGRALLVLAVRVTEEGKVLDIEAIEPPLRGLTSSLPTLIPRWTFEPAKKDGRGVGTWASYGVDLNLELEKGVWAAFSLGPVERDEPLAVVPREQQGEEWMNRYPKEISPKNSTVVSIEEVDFLPVPKKTSWKYESSRLRSRVTALVQVSAQGTVQRVVPTGPSPEPFLLTWVRKLAAGWKIDPAQAQGKPVGCWMTLDATLEYEIGTAKETAKRMFRKNLRGAPSK
jgi:hypothetical protein